MLGLYFAATSTADYVKHLDRQVHDVHCSFVPGAPVEEAENACRAALYSPYSAVFREQIWGGIPISLFAVGAFSFFIAFSLYLLMAGDQAPRRAHRFLGMAGLTPLAVSILMAVISATKLGAFCKTCTGIYVASGLLALGGVAGWVIDSRIPAGMPRQAPPPPGSPPGTPNTVVMDDGRPPRPLGTTTQMAVWLLALGLFALIPAGVYYQSVPSFAKQVTGCGKIVSAEDPKKSFLHINTGGREPVHMVVDPLCPTCKAFHQRLVSDGLLKKLDITLVLFPLDSECNWNLTTPLHPGACAVAKAVLCEEQRALQVLEWAYEEQDNLIAAAKGRDGNKAVLAAIGRRWQGLDACINDNKTTLRLDDHIRFATTNKLPVSTPQLFLGDTRLCDEDIDIGLPYALSKLAPSLVK